MKMVVSDSTDSDKIGWRTYQNLQREPGIVVHDCKIANTRQISDDRVRKEIREWLKESEGDELLVLIAGDQGYLRVLEEVRASGKNIHIFLICPKNVTHSVIENFEAEGRETWEDFLSEAQGGTSGDDDESGDGDGSGDGRGGGPGSKKGGGTDPKKPSTMFCNRTLKNILGPFKKPRQKLGYSGPITITGALSKFPHDILLEALSSYSPRDTVKLSRDWFDDTHLLADSGKRP
ncbi:PREDICTED: uncharacterized protein LOC104739230 [Camelina sativa]|uniref:Uncharacterized protein LOC104739230 n=1 Tax=Camelina sativa TaxID=90675 RepID=A0ABM0VL13_CAMSA|nr:PREDICTED: uncharacterized protein LOC104739230 [Camelina sativa]